MEAKAILRYARISPQKCRLVADTVRGTDVSKALNTLKFMPKKGADLVRKALDSAVWNAQKSGAEASPHSATSSAIIYCTGWVVGGWIPMSSVCRRRSPQSKRSWAGNMMI